MIGNDLATLPDFPAEIRAPAGTLHGVSAFQIHFASRDILTPGDYPNVLVAMNPAALKTNLEAVETRRHGDRQRGRVHRQQPEESRLRVEPARRRFARRLPGLSRADEEHHGARHRANRRRHNPRRRARKEPFRARPRVVALRPAHQGDCRLDRGQVLGASHRCAMRTWQPSGPATTSARRPSSWPSTTRSSRPRRAGHLPEHQRHERDGARARRRQRAQRIALFYASDPITPASELLQSSRSTSVSASARCRRRTKSRPSTSRSAHPLAVTSVSRRRAGPHGPQAGDDRVAVALELPLVVIDVQRAGPSTGMPTKTEAKTCSMAMYGRHGESPRPIVAASTPQGFDTALEAVRIAVKDRTRCSCCRTRSLRTRPSPGGFRTLRDCRASTPPSDRAEPGERSSPYLRDENMARPLGGPGNARPSAPDRWKHT